MSDTSRLLPDYRYSRPQLARPPLAIDSNLLIGVDRNQRDKVAAYNLARRKFELLVFWPVFLEYRAGASSGQHLGAMNSLLKQCCVVWPKHYGNDVSQALTAVGHGHFGHDKKGLAGDRLLASCVLNYNGAGGQLELLTFDRDFEKLGVPLFRKAQLDHRLFEEV